MKCYIVGNPKNEQDGQVSWSKALGSFRSTKTLKHVLTTPKTTVATNVNQVPQETRSTLSLESTTVPTN